MLQIGQIIDGYEILDVLGRGGMGVVYKARDTALRKLVAIKAINPMLVEDERFLSRFKSEGIAMARLEHPNIVGVKALRHTDGHLFLVMDFVAGGTLADYIEQEGGLSWQEALPLMKEALSAMQYAHDARVIHRDIKPRNLLLTRHKTIKVTDFGLAKIQEASSPGRLATRTGVTGGTIYYMPPEQLVGLSKVDHRGDIYSLGMTFYEMLAGRVPFDTTSSEFMILKAIDAHNFVSLDEVSDAPPELVRIIMKAIEREVEDRYQQASEMLSELEAFERQHERFERPKPAPMSAPDETMISPIRMKSLREKRPLAQQPVLFQNSFLDEPLEKRTTPEAQELPSGSAGASSRWLLPALLGMLTLLAVAAVVLVIMGDYFSGGEAEISSTTLSQATEALAEMDTTLAAVPPTTTPSGPGTIVIESEPVRAQVWSNGVRVGSTPYRATLEPGSYTFTLRKDGYRITVDTTVVVKGDDLHPLYYRLERAEQAPIAQNERVSPQVTTPPERPATGSVVLESQPSGVEVWSGGTRVGETPFRATLEPGSYTYLLRQEGYAEGTETVTIEAGQTSRPTIELEPLTGTLWVRVIPQGDVRVDGVMKAENTLQPFEEEVPVGTYRVEARHPVVGRWEKTVQVSGTGRQEVYFDFRQQFEIRVATMVEGRGVPGAQVIVDGEPTACSTPCEVQVSPGERRIEVRKPGFRMAGSSAVLMLDGDRSEPLIFDLEPVEGS